MNIRSVLIILVCALALGGSIFAVWHRQPSIAPPLAALKSSAPMPSPNGFDGMQQAVQALKEKAQISSEYIAAIKPTGRLADLPAKTQLVRQNATALTSFRTALIQEYRQPPLHTLNDTCPYYAGYRTLTRLLVLEGETKEGRRDITGALNSYLDGLHFGCVIPHGAPLIGMLVGNAMQTISRREIWPLLRTVNPAQARQVALQSAEFSKLEWEYADIMAAEKNIFQSTLQDIRAHPERYSNDEDMKGFAQMPPAMLKSLEKEHARVMDAMIRKAQQLYSPNQKEVRARGLINGTLLNILIPSFEKGQIKFLDSRAHNRLLSLAFALQAYKLEHNIYPNTLDKLTPGYLPVLPDDPFAKYGTFIYHPAGNTYQLYSIGPDGIDDHGTPFTNPNNSTGSPLRVKEGSKGDIVVGVNDY